MSSNSKSRSRSSRTRHHGRTAGDQTDTNAQMVAVLRSIDSKQNTQVRGSEPKVPDVPRLVLKREKVHTFEKTITLGLYAQTTTDSSNAYSFTLQSITDYTSLTNLFDCWRFAQITMDFVPFTTAQVTGMPPPLYSVIDYDDAVGPTSLTSLLEYDTLKVTEWGVVHTRTFTPRFAKAGYAGTFTAYTQSEPNDWVDAASSATLYYGCKIWTNAASIAGFGYYVTARIIVQCKNSR